MYGIYDPFGVKLINRLRLRFSNLREHKFGHNFADTVNPLCSCTQNTLKTQSISFYAAKTTYPLAQPL